MLQCQNRRGHKDLAGGGGTAPFGPLWLRACADGFIRRMYACSSPSGTEKPCSADTGELRLWVYTGHVVECPANVARSEAVGTSRDQTSGFRPSPNLQILNGIHKQGDYFTTEIMRWNVLNVLGYELKHWTSVYNLAGLISDVWFVSLCVEMGNEDGYL